MTINNKINEAMHENKSTTQKCTKPLIKLYYKNLGIISKKKHFIYSLFSKKPTSFIKLNIEIAEL